MYFLHVINSDRQTRLLNVLGQIAMILGDKKNHIHLDIKNYTFHVKSVFTSSGDTSLISISLDTCWVDKHFKHGNEDDKANSITGNVYCVILLSCPSYSSSL